MIALLASSPKNTVTLTRQRVVEVADPYNSPPPEIPRRSTKLAAINQLLGTFARKLASLKQYGLVRRTKYAVPSRFSDSFYHCGAAIGGLFLGGYKVVDFTFLCFFAGEPSSTPRSVKKKRQRSGSSIRCRRTFFI